VPRADGPMSNTDKPLSLKLTERTYHNPPQGAAKLPQNTPMGDAESVAEFNTGNTEMELADPSIITALFPETGEGVNRQPYSRRPKSSGQKRRGPVAKRIVCRCGECSTCHDNAKWERIFREKFEDPFYYSRWQERSGSALGLTVR
jgi:hypothetical protein